MDAARRQQLFRQRTAAKGMLTRMQNFIESGDLKINEIQVRYNKLPDIFTRYNSTK
jgi:hypothetical protein